MHERELGLPPRPMPNFRHRGLASVALNVTNLGRSVAFYKDLVGLQLVERNAATAVFRCGERHHDVVLYQSATASLKRVAFELESRRDWDLARRRFTETVWRWMRFHRPSRRAGA